MKNHTHFNDFIKKMEYFNYSKHTVKAYSHYLKEFLNKVGVMPSKLSSKHFTNYLFSYKFSSVSQQNQVINALKFFYEKVLNKKYAKIDFKRPRNEKKLPHIIDKDFLLEKILAIKNIKHKAILALAYSGGLRVSEVLNLKLKDIDSKRMILNIMQAKGRKDRIVPLSLPLLKILREYYKQEKPKVYLFNGQFSLQYSATSCNKLIKKYIAKDNSMHTLRHSAFTHLHESGVDIAIIKEIAGHKSIKTTQIYLHVSKQTLNKIQMPL